MFDYESPSHPFLILAQRLSRTDGKRVVIIDNACNIQNYCMQREPWIFRNIWFLVDRLDYANHINCSSCGYMRRDNFMLFIQHYMATLNHRRVNTIQVECQVRSSFKSAQWQELNAMLSEMQGAIQPPATQRP
ncbi:hypothetical protein H257_16918 [Aphanomyces astaci]|uniref:Uncharacterized protein n=1 Tax=Aphanomyces astaci TaxID=112090 RepID=W4FIZ9_APHAT|nr:hypothetical protein H257_16918 [Aphanomyces astaci]ETV66708.1 hypothetical protein H257_16918 [Aphanomyces astaci]|eukprot:XP_009843833.1 hypothetical protein H257_16918 [Aphanomyces astaci]